jgi:hypothetical protein
MRSTGGMGALSTALALPMLRPAGAAFKGLAAATRGARAAGTAGKALAPAARAAAPAAGGLRAPGLARAAEQFRHAPGKALSRAADSANWASMPGAGSLAAGALKARAMTRPAMNPGIRGAMAHPFRLAGHNIARGEQALINRFAGSRFAPGFERGVSRVTSDPRYRRLTDSFMGRLYSTKPGEGIVRSMGRGLGVPMGLQLGVETGLNQIAPAAAARGAGSRPMPGQRSPYQPYGTGFYGHGMYPALRSRNFRPPALSSNARLR